MAIPLRMGTWDTRKVRRQKAQISPEMDDQIKLVCWLKKEGIVFHSVPNEGKRSFAEAARMKAKGLMRGVPDLFVAMARKSYHGMYVELKAKRHGRLSEDQVYWLEQLNKQGYLAVCCRGFAEAQTAIADYLEIKL